MSVAIPEKLNSKSKSNQKLIFGAVKTAISNATKFKFTSCVGKDLYSDLLKFELTQVKGKISFLMNVGHNKDENRSTIEDR